MHGREREGKCGVNREIREKNADAKKYEMRNRPKL